MTIFDHLWWCRCQENCVNIFAISFKKKPLLLYFLLIRCKSDINWDNYEIVMNNYRKIGEIHYYFNSVYLLLAVSKCLFFLLSLIARDEIPIRHENDAFISFKIARKRMKMLFDIMRIFYPTHYGSIWVSNCK